MFQATLDAVGLGSSGDGTAPLLDEAAPDKVAAPAESETPRLSSGCCILSACWLVVLGCVGYYTVPFCIGWEGVIFVSVIPLAISAYFGVGHFVTGGFYLSVILVAAVRETFVIYGNSVPCGLCDFESVCEAPYGAAGANCTRWGVQQDTCWTEAPSADFTVVWAGAAALYGTIAMLFVQIIKFRGSGLEGWIMARVVVLLMVPSTYAICAFYSLRLLAQNKSDLWTPKSIGNIYDLYAALGLFAFKHIMVGCAGHKVERESQGGGEPHFKQIWSLGDVLMQLGCDPYLLWCFFGSFAQIVMREFVNWYDPELCQLAMPMMIQYLFPNLHSIDLRPPSSFIAFEGHGGSFACAASWHVVSPLFTAVRFIVCTLAVGSIVMYEKALGHFLHDVRPIMKFVGVKGLLMVTFWQEYLVPFIIPGDHWTHMQFDMFLLCWEAFILAVYHHFSYHPDDFKGIKKPTLKRAIAGPEKPVQKERASFKNPFAPAGGEAAGQGGDRKDVGFGEEEEPPPSSAMSCSILG
mmetsp:Transcript_6879/g.19273  ORF Transcript_6879/g.19273 Transcript_6879/m.19273 type:complete len:521 (+) Transcript_6879:58-1620(+)